MAKRKPTPEPFELDQDPTLGSLENDGSDFSDPSDSTPAAKGGDEDSKSKSDPSKRIRDLQSSNDKLRAEMKAQATKFAPLVPIGELWEKRPDVIARITEEMAKAEGPPALVAPKAPERPESFDEAESYNDPSSDSYKYRRAKEVYFMERLEFQDKKAEAQMEYFQKRESQQKEKEQLTQAETQLRSKLATLGVVGSGADEFVKFWQEGDTKLNRMVDFYKYDKGGRQRQARDDDFSPPFAVMGGAYSGDASESEEFSNGLLATQNQSAPKKFT